MENARECAVVRRLRFSCIYIFYFRLDTKSFMIRSGKCVITVRLVLVRSTQRYQDRLHKQTAIDRLVVFLHQMDL